MGCKCQVLKTAESFEQGTNRSTQRGQAKCLVAHRERPRSQLRKDEICENAEVGTCT